MYAPPNLQQEGFIHCSSREELLESAALHFPDDDELVVLAIVEKRVKHILRWEPGRAEKLFPHLYGPVPIDAVETTYSLLRLPNGTWEWIR